MNPRKRRRGRRLLVTAAILLAAWAALAVAKRRWDERTLHLYDPAVPLDVQAGPRALQDGFVREPFSFQALPGERVPVAAALPTGATNRLPAILFFYGSGMSMDFANKVDAVMTQAGFAFFVPEQYNRGERRIRGLSWLGEALAMRRRVFVTGQEMRRLVDAVSARSDVDPSRIYFWGASFGAMTCCRSVAEEPRIRASVMTLSGGDFARMVRESPARAQVPRWARPLARVAVWLLAPLDPVKTVGALAPRPVLFQNTRADDLIPRSCVEELYAAAGEPKEIAWYDMTHNHIQRDGVITLLQDGLAWVRRQDARLAPRAGGGGQ